MYKKLINNIMIHFNYMMKHKYKKNKDGEI